MSTNPVADSDAVTTNGGGGSLVGVVSLEDAAERQRVFVAALHGDYSRVQELPDHLRTWVLWQSKLPSGSESRDSEVLAEWEAQWVAAPDDVVREPWIEGFAPDGQVCPRTRTVCGGCVECLGPQVAIPTVQELEEMYAADAAESDERVMEETETSEPQVHVSVLVPGTWHREHERPPTVYRIDGYSAQGIITSLGGYPGAGKTPTELMFINALLNGESKFIGLAIGEVPDDYRVIYLTEESPQLFEAKIEAANMSDGALARLDIGYWDRNYTVQWARMIEEQSDRLAGNGMLVVDTALAWAGRLDEGSENDSSTMTDLYRPLMVAAANGLDVHVMVHTTKSVPNLRHDRDFNLGHIRGSGAVVASSGLVWGIKIPAATGRRADQRYLAVLRDKLTGRTDSMYTRLCPNPGLERISGWTNLLEGDDDGVADPGDRVLEAIDLLTGAGESPTSNAIRATAGMNKAATLKAIATLVRTGAIEQISLREGYRRSV